MAMATTLTFIVYTLLLLIHQVHSFSACDEIDVTFLIDTDSVFANPKGVIKFITSVIWSGSSEHTGFSAVIYGHNIPTNQKIKVISLHDTKDDTQRQKAEQLVDDKLQAAFNNIKHSQSPKRTVHLVPAFKIATGQSRPTHHSNMKRKLGYNVNDKSLGTHDNQQVYIIFDYKNKLLHDNNDVDICKLFDHLDNNAIQNDDEAPYFMLGHKFEKRIYKKIFCNSNIPQYIKKNTFYHFTKKFAFSRKRMERIYDLTCPATIKAKAYQGNINVGNHVQYIDAKTIIKCHLVYWDNDNNEATPDVLSSEKSYLEVKDFVNDDNTFKLFDYLVVPPNAYTEAKKLGCKESAFKITKIISTDTHIYGRDDSDKSNDYKVLQLHIQSPRVPQEYIREANCKGNVPVYKKAGYHKPHSHRTRRQREHTQSEEADEVSEEDEGEDIVHDDNGKPIAKLKYTKKKQTNSMGDDLSIDEDEFFKEVPHRMDNEWMDFDSQGRHHAPPPDASAEYNRKTEESMRRMLESEGREFDEIAMIKGGMDYLIEGNPVLEYYVNHILRIRAQRMKKLAMRLVNLKKTSISLARKWRHKNTFGAHAFEQEFLGKVGKSFKNAADQMKQTVKKEVKKVEKKVKKAVAVVKKKSKSYMKVSFNPLTKVGVETNLKLVDFSFKKDWTYTLSKSGSKTFGSKSPKGFSITIEASATVTIKTGFWFKLEVGCFFNFFWKILAGKIHMEFYIWGEWDIGAYFNLYFEGEMTILVNNILNYGKTITFSIGPVPVVIRPFIIIYAEIEAVPISLFAGIKCQYNERIELGFVFDTTGKKGPIKRKTTYKKGCTKEFRGSDEEDEECPVTELGFDLKLNVKIGCSLYVVVTVFLRMEFVVPFRMTIPEMDPTVCDYPEGTEACEISNYLSISFTISLSMNVYLGIATEFGKIFSVVAGLVFGGGGGGEPAEPGFEKKIVGPIVLIPKTTIACVELKGKVLEILNRGLRYRCCGEGDREAQVYQYGQYDQEKDDEGDYNEGENGEDDYNYNNGYGGPHPSPYGRQIIGYGPNGRPIYGNTRKIIGYGPNGRPVYGTVGPGGNVIGPNGRVVGRVGPNGKMVRGKGRGKGRPSKVIIHVYNNRFGPSKYGPNGKQPPMRNGPGVGGAGGNRQPHPLGGPPGGMMSQPQIPMNRMSVPRQQFRPLPQRRMRPPPLYRPPPPPIRGGGNRFQNIGHPLHRNKMLMNERINAPINNNNVVQPSPVQNNGQTFQQNNIPIMKQPIMKQPIMKQSVTKKQVNDVTEFGPYTPDNKAESAFDKVMEI